MAKKKKRRLKKKYRILRGIYIAVVVIAAIIVIAYAALKFTVRAPEIKQPDDTGSQTSQEIVPGMTTGDHTRREQTYTFMLCCPDQASGNADAIMLVTYDVPNQKIGMLSVPRDTLVDQSSPKINAAMHKGVENLQSVVSDLVGYPIDFYIKIDLDGFRELVDAAKEGYLAYAVFVIQLSPARFFAPNDRTHPAFGQALRQAAGEGVRLLAYDCQVSPEEIVLGQRVPIKL